MGNGMAGYVGLSLSPYILFSYFLGYLAGKLQCPSYIAWLLYYAWFTTDPSIRWTRVKVTMAV